MERFIDSNRGEIYFGKGIIFVEGIVEEYLIKQFADRLGQSLDENGIIICNISSTNFLPYLKLVNILNIPYVVITDGDYYEIADETEDRNYHVMRDDTCTNFGFLGLEVIEKTLNDLGMINRDISNRTIPEKRIYFQEYSCFIGEYTFEVDVFRISQSEEAKDIIFDTYNELTGKSRTKMRNFKTVFDNNDLWKCLSKIESNIGKGRFAQRFSDSFTIEHIPEYVKNAIIYLIGKVRGE